MLGRGGRAGDVRGWGAPGLTQFPGDVGEVPAEGRVIPLRRGESNVLQAPGPSIVTPVTNFLANTGFASHLSTISSRPASCNRNRRAGCRFPSGRLLFGER